MSLKNKCVDDGKLPRFQSLSLVLVLVCFLRFVTRGHLHTYGMRLVIRTCFRSHKYGNKERKYDEGFKSIVSTSSAKT